MQVMRNNAKSAVSDLEYQCSMVRQEKQQLTAELQVLQETVTELQVQCQCHLEDKRQLKAVLSETQRHLGDVERRLAEQERALADEKRLRQEEVCFSCINSEVMHVISFQEVLSFQLGCNIVFSDV
jgi:peptidoglycan hydrolase CwlO-like protein